MCTKKYVVKMEIKLVDKVESLYFNKSARLVSRTPNYELITLEIDRLEDLEIGDSIDKDRPVWPLVNMRFQEMHKKLNILKI